MDKKIKRSGIKKSSNKLILSFGESLLIYRKSHDLNQLDMAKKLDTTLHYYKLLEYDKASIAFSIPKNSKYVRYVISRELEQHEKCLIFRKRAHKTQSEVAREVGISRQWLRKLETGEVSCERLLRFWE